VNYWTLDPPKQWQAGTSGHGDNQTPFYFSCADCGTKDAVIAGILSSDGTYYGIGIIKIAGSFFVNPAMFCQPCFDIRLAKGNS
jgi:hypothetical protein